MEVVKHCWIGLVVYCVMSTIDIVDSSTKVNAGATPNIIFFLLDDFGYADLSATGAEYNTPNLDEFYGNSIELRSHYIGLLCSPSRTQILTGRYAWNFGISTMQAFGPSSLSNIPAGVPTIGNLLQEYTSYSTYVVAKWHVGLSTWEHTPLYRGFDHFYGFYTAGVDYYNKTAFGYLDWREDNNVDYATQYTFSTWSSRDRLLNIIDTHGSGENPNPFYVYAALQAPHETLEFVDSDFAQNCDHVENIDTRQLYCLNMMAVDQLFGEVVEGLKQNDLWEDTLIIFSSDNGGTYSGGACNYPYRGGKAGFFEGGVRTIALVGGGYIPSDQMGWKRTGLMHGADWTPTLLSIVGLDVNQIGNDLKSKIYQRTTVEISEAFDGIDLSRWLIYGDEDDNPRTNVGLSINLWNSTDDNAVSVVFVSNLTNHRYKLIKTVEHNGNYCKFCINQQTGLRYRCETTSVPTDSLYLFDLTLDYNETTNLYYSITYSKQKMKQFIEFHNQTNSMVTSQLNTKDIKDVWDYFVHGDISSSLVSQLWQEGRQVAQSYTENPLFNDFSDCSRTKFPHKASPEHFDDVYTPWWDFDEYVEKLTAYCGDIFNDALMTLYNTTYNT